MLINQANKNCN